MYYTRQTADGFPTTMSFPSQVLGFSNLGIRCCLSCGAVNPSILTGRIDLLARLLTNHLSAKRETIAKSCLSSNLSISTRSLITLERYADKFVISTMCFDWKHEKVVELIYFDIISLDNINTSSPCHQVPPLTPEQYISCLTSESDNPIKSIIYLFSPDGEIPPLLTSSITSCSSNCISIVL